MRSALAARDMGAVITIFRRWTGASQTDIGVLWGYPGLTDRADGSVRLLER
jgi:hypothetical protein